MKYATTDEMLGMLSKYTATKHFFHRSNLDSYFTNSKPKKNILDQKKKQRKLFMLFEIELKFNMREGCSFVILIQLGTTVNALCIAGCRLRFFFFSLLCSARRPSLQEKIDLPEKKRIMNVH